MATPKQLKEPSTYAGLGLILQAVAQLIATHGTDPTAWATIVAGAIAVFKTESQTNETPTE